MQLPLSDGARTLTEWVSARLDIAHDRAADLVDLARTDDLADLESGHRTVDRVMLRLRLAAAGASAETRGRSDGLDLTGVKRLIARHRRMTRLDHQTAFERRHLAFQDTLDGSLTRIWGELPGTDGAVVRNALEDVADRFPPAPDGRASLAQRHADALVALCQGDTEGPGVTAVVTVDATSAAVTGGETGGTWRAQESVRKLSKRSCAPAESR